MEFTPEEFVAAAARKLAGSAMLADDDIRFVSASVVGDPGSWPIQIEVRFADPAGDHYIWDAEPEACDDGADLDDAVVDWTIVAAANISEWVAVRDREEWQKVRPADHA